VDEERLAMVECLECGGELVAPAGARVGDSLTCPNCGESFVLVEVEPFEIDYPADDEDEAGWDEDWDEDWEAEEDGAEPA
jgi:hypothetical protein